MSNALKLLDGFSVDWGDFEQAGRATRQLIMEISMNRGYLRDLLQAVMDDDALMRQAESHQLLDRIVLYQADSRGFRLRLHISTDETLDRPHDHRFSFSSYILNGGYINRFYAINHSAFSGGLGKRIEHQDRFHPDPAVNMPPGSLTLLAITEEVKGSCYTLHHSAFHSVQTQRDTVSLFLRGPAEKEHSLIYDRTQNRAWWRFGQAMEPEERRKKLIMPRTRLVHLIDRMTDLGVA